MVLSEPLDSDASDWREVEMSQFVTACDGTYRMEPFRPVQYKIHPQLTLSEY